MMEWLQSKYEDVATMITMRCYSIPSYVFVEVVLCLDLVVMLDEMGDLSSLSSIFRVEKMSHKFTMYLSISIMIDPSFMQIIKVHHCIKNNDNTSSIV